ncbi:hypothetical protein LIER_22744 [Lithospermum erythrorhizon]|uniref:Reverse transcriptase domain-containing protein n=1 Tax=Lithospermum erythrorhizon TaxID=34254 RepID=A0AAV3R0P0_LITER
MSEFNNCVRDVGLPKHPHSSSQFSWCRNWKEQGVLKNLDRVLCNHGWFEKYRASMVNVATPSNSDHCTLNVSVYPDIPRELRAFKSQHFWSQHTSFQDIVSKVWEKDIVGDGRFVLHCKVKEVKKELKRLNYDEFSNISYRVKEKSIELEIANEKVYELTKDYERFYKAERELYQSKARISWYTNGNASTSLFHKSIKCHQSRNRLVHIQDDVGLLIEDYDRVKGIIVEFYQKLFSTSSTTDNSFDITQIVRKRITEEEAIMLSEQISVEEIEEAMLNMKMRKAPRLDGFITEFYKDGWPTVKQSVIDVVHTFFAICFMPKFFNSTTITLIPKVPNLVQMGDFRPISCCNSIYKCITTILASRLKRRLNSMVEMQQSVYVPGRSIIDGILLMQELVCGYHRKGGIHRCVLKVDIKKE